MATGNSEFWRPSDGVLREKLRNYVKYTPKGDTLSEHRWRSRHRNVLVLLALHVPFLFALGVFDGTAAGATFEAEPLVHVLAEVGLLGLFVVLASIPRFGRRARTAIAATGLMTSGAILAHFSGGFIEAHFHFFVMVGVIATYEDWLPFAISIVYVALEHGIFSLVDPAGVYNHPAAIANPWIWALIHAVFVLGLAGAVVSNWFSIERSREETREQLRKVKDSTEAMAEAEEAKARAEERKQEVEQLNESLLVHADDMAEAMERAADGDFTVEPPREAGIEAIEEIGSAYDEMRHGLSDTIRDLRAFATTVERTTESVHEDATSLEQNQQSLAEDTREFARDLRQQAENLESATGEMSTLSATIEEIAANADEVSTEAGRAADAAEDGTMTAEEAIEAIEEIEASVAELGSLVETLDDRMDEVSESTALIDDVAEQTNMLALNANIEAARAENDSDGFAVVADEVKELADETRDHSAAIESVVEETIADVDRVKAEMRQTRERIERGEETMTEAGDAFGALADTVETVDHSVDEVAMATDDGARTTEEVVNAITDMADRSREVADLSESLAERAETGASTVGSVRAQLDELTEHTATLQNQLQTFETAGD